MLEFFAGYLLANANRSPKQHKTLTPEKKSQLLLARMATLSAMALSIGFALTMLVKGPFWNPAEAFLSYMPSGWLFWIASTSTAIVTGFLALVGIPLAGPGFRLTVFVMMLATVNPLVSVVMP